MTSFKACAIVRRLTGEASVGHGGTLDPEATGVLPVLLGRSTKLSDEFLTFRKTYVAEMTFGIKTDTGDIWGQIAKIDESLVASIDYPKLGDLESNSTSNVDLEGQKAIKDACDSYSQPCDLESNSTSNVDLEGQKSINDACANYSQPCGHESNGTSNVDIEKQKAIKDAKKAKNATICYKNKNKITANQVAETLASFIGESEQMPPAYSALKVSGVPAYKLARQGKEPDLKARKINIYAIELQHFDGTKAVFSVTCSRGTYIRVLCEDIAKKLGTIATMSALERTSYGSFDAKDAMRISDLEIFYGMSADKNAPEDPNPSAQIIANRRNLHPDWLLPPDAALESLPRVNLSDKEYKDYVAGRNFTLGDHIPNGRIRLYTDDGRLVGTAVRDRTVLRHEIFLED